MMGNYVSHESYIAYPEMMASGKTSRVKFLVIKLLDSY